MIEKLQIETDEMIALKLSEFWQLIDATIENTIELMGREHNIDDIKEEVRADVDFGLYQMLRVES